jgi:hypothetical protein
MVDIRPLKPFGMLKAMLLIKINARAAGYAG